VPRVLIVDDDPSICHTIQVLLERKGFVVVAADGGDTGLQILQQASFDLMIVDIFMPRLRGFESIRIFHERAPTVPLIAMSGYAFAKASEPTPDFLRLALELGASCCLRKPFTSVALLAAVNECLVNAPIRLANADSFR
jgi:CheY-like chemotaxis protein